MANELDYDAYGHPVTLHFGVANVAANATTNLTLPQGGSFVVPTGYKFHPMMLNGISNADLSAGGATFNVTANGTAVAGAPTAALSDTVQRAAGVARVGAAPIAAGQLVAVNIVADANFAPNTADVDAVLSGVLLPA
jgi:hypothetical protein